jgi:hypothetical protein
MGAESTQNPNAITLGVPDFGAFQMAKVDEDGPAGRARG